MAEKGKPRGGGTKSKQDKPARPQPRQAKKASPRTPGRTPSQPTPSPDTVSELQEPLDVEPILNDLLERVLAECARAAAARQRVPFTVSRVRDAILFVAEWRFLVRDEGDPARDGDPGPERDGIWSEDEEPQTCSWDSSTPGVVTVVDVSPLWGEVPLEDFSEVAEVDSLLLGLSEDSDATLVLEEPLTPSQVPSENLSVAAEAEGQLACLGEVTAALHVLDVPLPADQPLSAAAAAPPVPEPPRPEPPTAPRPPGRGRRLSQAPGRGRRPSRPRAAPLAAPRPPEPPAQAPQEPRKATMEVGDKAPPPPPSWRPSPASMQPRRASRGTGVPRLGAHRGAARWVLPEVKVVDVTTESDRARLGASRTRLAPPESPPALPESRRSTKAEPQLCDPWLASARLAPGVTVRWGGSERRGPAPVGHGRDDKHEEEEEEALRKAEKSLKPILPYPECRLSEYD